MINDRIRELINYLDITQVEFAKSIGTDQSTISKYLSGKREPTMAICNSIIRQYSICKEWLYYGKGNMFEENLEKEKIYLINKIKNMSEKELRLFSDFLKYVYRTDDKFKKIESDRDN